MTKVVWSITRAHEGSAKPNPGPTWSDKWNHHLPSVAGHTTPKTLTRPSMETSKRQPQLARPRPDTRSLVPCRFHAEGRCLSGTRCVFSHAITSQTDAAVPTAAIVSISLPVRQNINARTPQQDWQSRIPCRFARLGFCSKGEECPFAHDTLEGVPVPKPGVEIEVIQALSHMCDDHRG